MQKNLLVKWALNKKDERVKTAEEAGKGLKSLDIFKSNEGVTEFSV